jgi:hypothetical protein
MAPQPGFRCRHQSDSSTERNGCPPRHLTDGYLEHAPPPETLIGLFLTTAVVLRLIKTRAEVNGWSKADAAVDSREFRDRLSVPFSFQID